MWLYSLLYHTEVPFPVFFPVCCCFLPGVAGWLLHDCSFHPPVTNYPQQRTALRSVSPITHFTSFQVFFALLEGVCPVWLRKAMCQSYIASSFTCMIALTARTPMNHIRKLQTHQVKPVEARTFNSYFHSQQSKVSTKGRVQNWVNR